jgi:hypothetical protein
MTRYWRLLSRNHFRASSIAVISASNAGERLRGLSYCGVRTLVVLGDYPPQPGGLPERTICPSLDGGLQMRFMPRDLGVRV